MKSIKGRVLLRTLDIAVSLSVILYPAISLAKNGNLHQKLSLVTSDGDTIVEEMETATISYPSADRDGDIISIVVGYALDKSGRIINPVPLIETKCTAGSCVGGFSYTTSIDNLPAGSVTTYLQGFCLRGKILNGTDVISIDTVGNGRNATLNFSTFLGGKDKEWIRDIHIDSRGYVYLVGGTSSSDFPITADADDSRYDAGGSLPMDAFFVVMKPDGKGGYSQEYGTFYGASGYERFYGIDIAELSTPDSDGATIVAAMTGRGSDHLTHPKGVLQEKFDGQYSTHYGWQDAILVVFKYIPGTGWKKQCSTYAGRAEAHRDLNMGMGSDGKLYAYLTGIAKIGVDLPSSWTTGAFQPSRAGGAEQTVVRVPVDTCGLVTSGPQATYFGGSADEYQTPTGGLVRDGLVVESVVIGSASFSTDLPGASSGYQSKMSGSGDMYVAKLSPDLTTLQAATFLGGAGTPGLETHNMFITGDGTIYLGFADDGSSLALGTGDQCYGVIGKKFNGVVAGLTNDLKSLLGCHVIGGTEGEIAEGVAVGPDGTVVLTGTTFSKDFQVTSDAYQSTQSNTIGDSFVAKFSADFKEVEYATYLGGSGKDEGRTVAVSASGEFCIAGAGESGYPVTNNAFDATFNGGQNDTVVSCFLPY